MNGSMIPIERAQGVFASVAGQPAYFMDMDGMHFKEAVHKAFPGGVFSKINLKPTALGQVKRACGTVWQAPTFKLSQLAEYFKSFDCEVQARKMSIN